jgi:hypothetical protein
MATYLTTIGLILLMLLGYVVVERVYRLFARRHPELGPFRGEHGGCGGCAGGHCDGDGRGECRTPARPD